MIEFADGFGLVEESPGVIFIRRQFGGQHRTECRRSRESRVVGAFVGTMEEFDIEPTVEANGNKPISPLSVAAEPPCVSENELQLGRR